MGLDIYLYRYDNKNLSDELEKKYESLSEESWDKAGSYETLTASQKKTLRENDEKIALDLGLNKNGEYPGREHVRMDSKIHPDHMFKIGYFRSSYNDGGINRVLEKFGLMGLYEIFNHDGKDYCFQPDWNEVLKRTKKTKKLILDKPNITCFDVSWNDFKNPAECEITSEADALKIFMDEKKAQHSFDGYSNINGVFHIKEPIKVYGLVSGVKETILTKIKLPCCYVIAEGSNEWYVQALEVIQETTEFVLAQPDKEQYWLHWSG